MHILSTDLSKAKEWVIFHLLNTHEDSRGKDIWGGDTILGKKIAFLSMSKSLNPLRLLKSLPPATINRNVPLNTQLGSGAMWTNLMEQEIKS